jgi:hypothetical protein
MKMSICPQFCLNFPLWDDFLDKVHNSISSYQTGWTWHISNFNHNYLTYSAQSSTQRFGFMFEVCTKDKNDHMINIYTLQIYFLSQLLLPQSSNILEKSFQHFQKEFDYIMNHIPQCWKKEYMKWMENLEVSRYFMRGEVYGLTNGMPNYRSLLRVCSSLTIAIFPAKPAMYS